MIAFFCLFFPAILSVCIYEKLIKEDLNIKKWIYLYTLNTMLINLVCFSFKTVVLQTGEYPFFELYYDMLPVAAMKYLFLAIPSAIMFAVGEVLLKKSLRFTIEAELNGTNPK